MEKKLFYHSSKLAFLFATLSLFSCQKRDLKDIPFSSTPVQTEMRNIRIVDTAGNYNQTTCLTSLFLKSDPKLYRDAARFIFGPDTLTLYQGKITGTANGKNVQELETISINPCSPEEGCGMGVSLDIVRGYYDMNRVRCPVTDPFYNAMSNVETSGIERK